MMWSILQKTGNSSLSRLARKGLGKSRQFLSTKPMVSSTSSYMDPSSFSEANFVPKPQGLTIGILRETYCGWERRAPLCPHHVQELLSGSGLNKVLIQPSSQRCFSNMEYEQAGAVVSDDLSHADIILGVKRPVDPESMIEDKTYVFFSHVIKGQESNMGLLQRVLDKKIQLVDYECIVEEDANGRHNRLVAFGKYAGLAGMIDTFYPLGRRLVSDYGIHTPFIKCPLASMQKDLAHAKQTIQQIGEQIAYEGMPDEFGEPLVFTVTGKGGRVYGGAMEILDLLPQERILAKDLPELFAQSNRDPYKVYSVTPSPEEMYYRKDDGSFSYEDWQKEPEDYASRFATHIAPYTHAMVNCIYWDPRYARLLTKDEVQTLHENGQKRLMVVSDISCDVNGSIEFLDRSCTIDRPFFQYNPLTHTEVCADIGDKGITVMGTDILPAELPKESSDHFGNAVVKVLNELFDSRAEKTANTVSMDLKGGPEVLSTACITTPDGELRDKFHYLESFLKMHPSPVADKTESIEVLLNGHLFDSGLINAVLDAAEHLNCHFHIVNCRVNRGGDPMDVVPTEKSTALVHFSTDNQEDLDELERKIQTLVNVMDKADASAKVVDRHGSKAKGDSTGGSTQKSSTAVVESQEEQRVLVLGAGRVSMSLVDLLGRTAQKDIHVASDNEQEAKDVAQIAQQGRHVALDLRNEQKLAELVKGKDVVISLLPAPLHPLVAEECIKQRTNLVTASYESPAMKEMNERAKEAGIIILNEVGLDPGLDHMSAMKIIDDVTSRGGTIRSFQSVCGGLPAPEAANNPLKYKFSWSPKGVISASQNAARYRLNDEIVEVEGTDLMRSGKPFPDAWPDLQLECLPNRDSLKYESIYGIDKAHTLFRGTLRFEGFCKLMSVFQKMGLFQDVGVKGQTWKEVIASLRGSQSLEEFLLECSGRDSSMAQEAREALEWLEMTGAAAVSHPSSLVDSFCNVLEQHLQFAEGERDMVAMHTAIEASFEGGPNEIHQSSLIAFGDETMSAMCRTVGFPTAAAADLVLSGALKDHKGLLLPIEKEVYLPILAAVEKEGIVFDESVTTKTA